MGLCPCYSPSLFHNSFLLKFIIFFGREKGRFMAGISQLVFFIIQMPKKKREEKSVNKVATTIPKKRAYCIQLSERTVGQQQREYREKCRSAFRAVLGGKRGVLHIKIWDYGKPVSYGLCIRWKFRKKRQTNKQNKLVLNRCLGWINCTIANGWMCVVYIYLLGEPVTCGSCEQPLNFPSLFESINKFIRALLAYMEFDANACFSMDINQIWKFSYRAFHSMSWCHTMAASAHHFPIRFSYFSRVLVNLLFGGQTTHVENFFSVDADLLVLQGKPFSMRLQKHAWKGRL